ncbi:uncharacterized protein BJ212DRAFT_1478100 [Suillus subaureus]|uniref:Uncharacterized protein n=1 Tax=Suillus subaureus TaxID=48587 RepID=A0A9P7EGY1_9AGAM|nr:uncharacterized protein BJ212DRAFT_1478100 [Suillus subaureus]KAG1820997.1 hypothetical protein BJ212DRAFT_1478100 [Suillus subaureus]
MDADDDLQEPESVIQFLSAEIPTFVSMLEVKRYDFPLTKPTWPHISASKLMQKTGPSLSKQIVGTKLRETAEPFPFSLAQPRAPVTSMTKNQLKTGGHTIAKAQSAYDSNDVEELKAASDDHNDPKSPNNNDNNDYHYHSEELSYPHIWISDPIHILSPIPSTSYLPLTSHHPICHSSSLVHNSSEFTISACLLSVVP